MNLYIFFDKYNCSMSLFVTYSALYHKYELTERNLLVLFFQEISSPQFEMEEGDYSVEQSIKAKAQGEAPTLQNVSGLVAPALQMSQFSTQFAQQMAAMFQQM